MAAVSVVLIGAPPNIGLGSYQNGGQPFGKAKGRLRLDRPFHGDIQMGRRPKAARTKEEACGRRRGQVC